MNQTHTTCSSCETNLLTGIIQSKECCLESIKLLQDILSKEIKEREDQLKTVNKIIFIWEQTAMNEEKRREKKESERALFIAAAASPSKEPCPNVLCGKTNYRLNHEETKFVCRECGNTWDSAPS
jgi:hypothetical protein